MQFLFLCFTERRDGNVAVDVNSQVRCAARACGIVQSECEIVPASPSSIRPGVVDVGSRKNGAVCASLERDRPRMTSVDGNAFRVEASDSRSLISKGIAGRFGSQGGLRTQDRGGICQWLLSVRAAARRKPGKAADTSSPLRARRRDGRSFVRGRRASHAPDAMNDYSAGAPPVHEEGWIRRAGSRLYGPVPFNPWIYLVLACVFKAVHATHAR